MITPGAKVSEGQPVMELETDKAVVEVPSSVSGVVQRDQSQGRREGQSRPGHLHARGWRFAQLQPPKRQTAPVEHVSGQQAARLAFQPAMQAEGKTEEQALPPDRPQPARARHSPCRCNSAKLQAPSIANLFLRRRMSDALPAKSAWTSTMSRARAPADASAKTM